MVHFPPLEKVRRICQIQNAMWEGWSNSTVLYPVAANCGTWHGVQAVVVVGGGGSGGGWWVEWDAVEGGGD